MSTYPSDTRKRYKTKAFEAWFEVLRIEWKLYDGVPLFEVALGTKAIWWSKQILKRLTAERLLAAVSKDSSLSTTLVDYLNNLRSAPLSDSGFAVQSLYMDSSVSDLKVSQLLSLASDVMGQDQLIRVQQSRGNTTWAF
ncbi:hypothetical protein [Silvimonas iriomotensis]|uniref:Uncharacterized protein n=1 Tax=Silvimonas iriomotensis TaxID=449662 RepID=A0ABQ2PBW7_9NEIS|nr:hypothetical protein [Silvimonas iriomotensis]GGP23029.1 hypothetical protein GCM10010970_30290 [Silvimonas iriomotensis]